MKISTNSYWFKSGIFSLLQNFFTLIFGFGGFYLLVRILSKEEFGGWTLFLAVTSMLEVGRAGFVKNGFIKFRAAEEEKLHGTIFTASFLLNSSFAILASIGIVIAAHPLAVLWNTPVLENMFYIYAITSIVLIPFFQFEFLLHAVLDFKSVFITYFVRNGFSFIAILLGSLHLYEINLTYLVLFHLSGAILASLISYILVKDILQFSKTIEWEWIWKLTHYGKYVIGTSLSAMLYSSADQFMLGSMVSTTSVALYSAAGRITNLVNAPSMTLSTILFPKTAQLISTDGKAAVKELYEKSVGSIIGIALPAIVFVFLFTEFVINTTVGAAYLDAVGILKITIFFSFFLPFSYQFGTVFDSIGFPNINFYCTSISLLVNIRLNYFLISKYGIYGAVYGTSFTLLASFTVMQFLLKRKLNVSTLNVLRFTFTFYRNCFIYAKSIIIKNSEEK